MLLQDLCAQLTTYLVSGQSLEDLELWLASFDWDKDSGLTDAERGLLAQFELIATEVAEGWRDQTEFAAVALSCLRQFGAVPEWAGTFASARSSDSVTRYREDLVLSSSETTASTPSDQWLQQLSIIATDPVQRSSQSESRSLRLVLS